MHQAALALSLLTTSLVCAACGETGRPPPPDARLVIRDPVALPEARAGQDARVALAEMTAAAAENARRLRQAQAAYRRAAGE